MVETTYMLAMGINYLSHIGKYNALLKTLHDNLNFKNVLYICKLKKNLLSI